MKRKLPISTARFRSIKGRIWVAMLLGIVLLCLVGASTYNTMRHLAAVPEKVFQHTYTVGLALRDLRADVLIMHNRLDSLSREPSILSLRRFEREMGDLDQRVSEHLSLIEDRFLGEQALIDGVWIALREWQPVRESVIEAIKAGDRVAAYTLIKTAASGQIAEIKSRLGALQAGANVQTATLRERSRAMRQRVLLEQALTLLLALFGMIGTIRFIGGSVIAPTAEISSAIQKVAGGELATPIPHTGREDEIGEIARSTQVFLKRAIAIRDSHFDVLTGLPTRNQLVEHIEAIRGDSATRERSAALMYFDLDRFSDINDSFGRAAGDQVLIHVASVLRKIARLGDYAARDTSDSFALFVLDREDPDEVQRLVEQIRTDIERPILIGAETISVTCCVGMTKCRPEAPVSEMLSEAENALTEARKHGSGVVKVYTEEMDARLRWRRETLNGLKFALTHDEITPFFQPQIDALSGELVGFEALVRWNHPEQGVLSPWQFIEVAESAGLLSALTDTMIAKSIDQLALWRKSGFLVPRVSLNLAAVDLARPDFVDLLMLHVERANLSPKDICIELLETAMIEDTSDPVSRALDRLGEIGFPIELDDFGTGHAAISTLHLIKLNGIKIDRSFITNLHERPEQQHLTRGILRISKALQICSVAEGVENEEERTMLVELGCEVIQGFVIAQPMSGVDATEWMLSYEPVLQPAPVAASA